MNNSVSENSFIIESDEEDEEKDLNKGGVDGNDSDSSNYSNENPPQRKPSSYNISWPQSYRQSIDLYSSVPSPNIGYLGTPSLSRLSSSFLSTSLTRRHTPEALPSVAKPLIQDTEDEQHQRRSSHTLLPPLPSRRSSLIKKDSKVIHHEVPSGHCSFGQAVLNGINVLCGVGILSTPYAAKVGGWLGLSILVIFAIISFYTGLLLRSCLDSEPELETYPDIGQAAFGTTGRIAISIVLYVELYVSTDAFTQQSAASIPFVVSPIACCIEYIILEGDNLSSLFPSAHLNLGGIELNSHTLFAVITTLAVLPTVWLRDLSILSYISAGGVVASILVVLCLLWVGIEDVGFHSKGTTLNLATLPVAVGLYGYCYSGHAVFPNIYTSMANPNQFPGVLLACFGICTLLYAGAAVLGYTMFGEAILSQFTLNMPKELVATKIAVWTTVVNPFTKYPLYLHVCVDYIPSGNESGGVDTIKPCQVLSIFHLHQNRVGTFYPGYWSLSSLFWSGDVIDWIITHNACYFDTTLCLFPKNLAGQSDTNTGSTLHYNYHSRCCMFCFWIILRPCRDCEEFEGMKF
ncbi:Amino acid transporter AVT1C [Glycine max]|nr:Amino acid transporter AVT1C [Glycine max]KAH1191463.1 Amino acid transporter AVT1C [Glycine max]KAH1191468.1 Amino acid transporter AVT1C [Glycine max]